ncbi:MAG: YIP1 family protein [Steroidobacteraceae bacterium]
MGNWSLLQALIFEPRKAFAEIAERPRFWFPLLLLLLTTAGVSLWYTSVVDMEWLVDHQIRASGFAGMMTEQQITERAHQAGQRQGLQAAIATGASAFVAVLMLLIGTLYYVLAGKVTNVDRTFRQWFAFSAWTSLPAVLGIIPAAFVLLTAASAQIPQEELQPLSFNALFFQRTAGEPGYTLLNSLNLLQIAALYLGAVGVKLWSGRSWLFSALFVALPYLLVFGIWAFIALR